MLTLTLSSAKLPPHGFSLFKSITQTITFKVTMWPQSLLSYKEVVKSKEHKFPRKVDSNINILDTMHHKSIYDHQRQVVKMICRMYSPELLVSICLPQLLH